jgi:hypothetical protein
MFNNRLPLFFYLYIAAILCLLPSCKKTDTAKSAFYYWKSSFSLNEQQRGILKDVADNTLYLRFFDITWDERTQTALPNAVISFAQPASKLAVTPVIFIANKTFEQIKDNAIDSLATHCNALVNHIAETANIHYQNIQFDCDWTLTSREKYFAFLKAFKKINQHKLQVTIRLHQIKYKERTGVPPADKGVLMFYNMGTLNANLQQANSIYNEADAEKYIAYIPKYPLKLDVALPLFSWAVHIREGRVIQLYGNIGKKELGNTLNFAPAGEAFRAKKNFFLKGVYIKENDIFKLEQTDIRSLEKAVGQLSGYLPPEPNRTVIYYELGNLNLSEFKAETLREVSADL